MKREEKSSAGLLCDFFKVQIKNLNVTINILSSSCCLSCKDCILCSARSAGLSWELEAGLAGPGPAGALSGGLRDVVSLA